MIVEMRCLRQYGLYYPEIFYMHEYLACKQTLGRTDYSHIQLAIL